MAKDETSPRQPEAAIARIMRHFDGLSAEELVTVERIFPTTVQPDLEGAIDALMQGAVGNVVFAGISGGQMLRALTFAALVSDRREPAVIGAAQYMDIDIGETDSGRCVVSGVWMFHYGHGPAALLISHQPHHQGEPGVRAEMIMSPAAGGRDAGQALLTSLARGLTEKSVYRGKALSFETAHSYFGGLGALRVHRLPQITLDQVILPKGTLDVLQRTVFGFVKARDALRAKGFSAKRGLLLYGPPGTGKTHFIRYLLANLHEHTSLLVTAEQVGAFDQIMSIARALQPAVVVIEDADLLARSRDESSGPCSEVLLNKLLNHMDGLTDDAEIIFVLTTNRPQALESAVRDRPGRIDQAIEIPRPDADCRARLLNLYRNGMVMDEGVAVEVVRRTEGVSASFIREAARRMAQYAILGGRDRIELDDMRPAFEEMLGAGSFTATALGAEALDN